MHKAAQRNVTLQGIARRCRVAKSTVSLALRGDSRVDERTAARIRRAAEKLGYNGSAHESARRLALRKYGARAVSKVIGFLCPAVSYSFPFYARMLQGLLEGLAPQGFNLVAGTFVRDASGEISVHTSLEHLIRREDLDGLIFYSDTQSFLPVLRHLRRDGGLADRPVLSLMFRSPGCCSVLVDEENGGLAAARHLLDEGHRQFVQFCTLDPANGQPLTPDRWRGVRRALVERGLVPEKSLQVLQAPRPWVDPVAVPHAVGEISSALVTPDGSRLVEHLRANPKVTAILAQNDSSALHAWHTLYRAGIRVPEDISITGFDDTDPMVDEGGRNLLTTVRLPLAQVGQQAAKLIMCRVLGEAKRDQELTLPVQFIPRASTARVKAVGHLERGVSGIGPRV
ncbi:MAG TPA: LacI family DNA-binding transcriptional regulator [Planctomycetota bacterium]|jgi:DNA-binding LacI/PurR family transcriptional regulator